MRIDDRIAEKVLSDAPYERLRARQFSYLAVPNDRKIAWQSYLLFALAALLPALAITPPGIRQAYLNDVAAATPNLAFIALVAVTFVVGGGLGLTAIESFRLNHAPLDERQAREAVTFETLCTMLGLGTGGFATATTYALVALGLGGKRALDAFLALGGGNPFTPSLFGVSVVSVATIALVSAVGLQVAAAYLRVRGVRHQLAY